MACRTPLPLLAALALAGSACHPVIDLNSNPGAGYEKRAQKARDDFRNKLSSASTPDEIKAALEGTKREPLLHADGAVRLFRAGDAAGAVAEAGVALDNASALPTPLGYRNAFMADMFRLQASAHLWAGNADEAGKVVTECLAYPDLKGCLGVAVTVAVRRKDAVASLDHLRSLWSLSPGFDQDTNVLYAAAAFPGSLPALRDLYKSSYQPQWNRQDLRKRKQLILAWLESASGNADGAREAAAEVGLNAQTGMINLDDGSDSPTPTCSPTVAAVLPGSAAARAGVAACDELASINGNPTATCFDVRAEMERLAATTAVGATVPLVVKRAGTEHKLAMAWGVHDPVGASTPATVAACDTATALTIPTRYGR